MFNSYLDKCHEYFAAFERFTRQHEIADAYVLTASRVTDYSPNIRLFEYDSDKKEVFLIVPSIFNSPEILFINESFHFVDYLRKMGKVYLIDWQEIKIFPYSLGDYAAEAGKVIDYVCKKHNKSVTLIGHCIGGNLALAASLQRQDFIKSLTLLTSPWDFSHFKIAYQLHKLLGLDIHIELLRNVPRVYVQILFFLNCTESFHKKIDKFHSFSLSTNNLKRMFRVERWLLSGHSLPKAAYLELLQGVVENDLMKRGMWLAQGFKVDPGLFKRPVCQVIAAGDHLVPENSILPLQKALIDATILRVPGGHISYLISPEVQPFFDQYKAWLRKGKTI